MKPFLISFVNMSNFKNMSELPYRPYECKRQYIENGTLMTVSQFLNLSEVKDFSSFKFSSIEDNVKRTYVELYDGRGLALMVPYDDFKATYLDYLLDYNDIDPRSMIKKKTDRNTAFEVLKASGGILEYYHRLIPIKPIFHAPNNQNMRISIYENTQYGPLEDGNIGNKHLTDQCIFFN